MTRKGSRRMSSGSATTPESSTSSVRRRAGDHRCPDVKKRSAQAASLETDKRHNVADRSRRLAVATFDAIDLDQVARAGGEIDLLRAEDQAIGQAKLRGAGLVVVHLPGVADLV